MATNGNVVTVVLNAKDNASHIFTGLTGIIEGATLKANILSNALSTGLSSGISALTGKLREAADIQSDNLATAGTYAALVGRNISDAENAFSGLYKEIDGYAGALPGVSQDFKNIASGIQTDLIPAFTNLNGVFDEGKYFKYISAVTKGLGVLGAQSKIDPKYTVEFTDKLIQGRSVDQLKESLFAEKNGSFLPAYERQLRKLGTDQEKATRAQRAFALKTVTETLVTPDLIEKNANSINGLLGSLKDKFFSPTNGVFGLLKNLDSKASGNQSVLGAFNDTLKIIVGDNGLLDTIGKLFTKLGIDPDFILKSLKGGIGNVNTFLSNLNNTLKSFDSSSTNRAELVDKFNSFISNLFNIKGVGKDLGSIFNNGVSALRSLNWVLIFRGISTELTSIFNEISSFFKSIDYYNLGNLINDSFGSFFNEISKAFTGLSSIDWGAKLAVIVNDAFIALGKLDWNNIFSGLGIVLADVLNTVLHFLEKIDTVAIYNTIISIITGMFNGLGVFLAHIDWDSVAEIFKDILKASMETLGKSIGDAINEINYFLQNLVNKLTFQDSITANSVGQGNDIAAKASRGEIPKSVAIEELRRGLPNRANGQGFESLMSAISKEKKAAPSGAGIVIANSTEAILNRQQQSQLTSSTVRGGGLNIGSIVINTAATNGQEIAETVMQHITDQWSRYTQNNLATAI